MKEQDYIKADEVYKELVKARKELKDIDGLLSHSGNNIITLRNTVGVTAEDDERLTTITLSKEFQEIIDLVKDIRLKAVEDLESKFHSI